jgi:hypothetical protein
MAPVPEAARTRLDDQPVQLRAEVSGRGNLDLVSLRGLATARTRLCGRSARLDAEASGRSKLDRALLRGPATAHIRPGDRHVQLHTGAPLRNHLDRELPRDPAGACRLRIAQVERLGTTESLRVCTGRVLHRDPEEGWRSPDHLPRAAVCVRYYPARELPHVRAAARTRLCVYEMRRRVGESLHKYLDHAWPHSRGGLDTRRYTHSQPR